MKLIETENGITTETALKECLFEVDKLCGDLLDLFVAIPNQSLSGDLVKDAYIKMLNASRAIRNELKED